MLLSLIDFCGFRKWCLDTYNIATDRCASQCIYVFFLFIWYLGLCAGLFIYERIWKYLFCMIHNMYPFTALRPLIPRAKLGYNLFLISKPDRLGTNLIYLYFESVPLLVKGTWLRKCICRLLEKLSWGRMTVLQCFVNWAAKVLNAKGEKSLFLLASVW